MQESEEPFATGNPAPNKPSETRAFLFLTIVLVPVLAVAFVGGYGLIVWIYQMLAGPPGG
jgi:periplasmic nitrate reductase NapE